MKSFVPYPDEVKDPIVHSFKDKLKGVTILTLYPKRTSNEHIGDNTEDAGTNARVLRGRRPNKKV